ncbi:hypothetical protein HDV64DRAFT_259847 [Trichoderma sp. TUCIM 5745]
MPGLNKKVTRLLLIGNPAASAFALVLYRDRGPLILQHLGLLYRISLRAGSKAKHSTCKWSPPVSAKAKKTFRARSSFTKKVNLG